MLSEDVISTAEAYIERHGDLLQRARVAALVRQTPPSSEAIARWREGWQADGGWASSGATGLPPGETRGRSNFIATARALRYSQELGLGIVAEVRAALLWLTRQQRRDGSFIDEYPIVSDALDAKRLGVTDDRMIVWATATALNFLDECIPGVPPFGAARQRAYEWLARYENAWDTLHSRTIWLSAAAVLRREGPESPTALKLTAVLALRQSDETRPLTARDLADLTAALTGAGWPASQPPVSGAMTLLARLRRDDGAFADPLEREDIVEATLAAIRAYIAAGKVIVRR